MAEVYSRCWSTEPDEKGNVALVVEQGSPKSPYWWVLCPADSTLWLSVPEPGLGGDGTNGESCSLGLSCDFDALHEAAHAIIRARSEGRHLHGPTDG